MDQIGDRGFDPSGPLDTESRLQLIALAESMRRLALALLMAGLLLGLIALSSPAWSSGQPQICSTLARTLKFTCHAGLTDDYWVALTNCLNLSDLSDQRTCQIEARRTRHQERGICRAQYAERLELCSSGEETAFQAGPEPRRGPLQFTLAP